MALLARHFCFRVKHREQIHKERLEEAAKMLKIKDEEEKRRQGRLDALRNTVRCLLHHKLLQDQIRPVVFKLLHKFCATIEFFQRLKI